MGNIGGKFSAELFAPNAFITENMSEGFLVINSERNVLTYNSAALRLLEISEPPRFIIISAKPEMEVRGVFSSWETLAVNSLRSCSRLTRSVTSKMTITAPDG